MPTAETPMLAYRKQPCEMPLYTQTTSLGGPWVCARFVEHYFGLTPPPSYITVVVSDKPLAQAVPAKVWEDGADGSVLLWRALKGAPWSSPTAAADGSDVMYNRLAKWLRDRWCFDKPKVLYISVFRKTGEDVIQCAEEPNERNVMPCITTVAPYFAQLTSDEKTRLAKAFDQGPREVLQVLKDLKETYGPAPRYDAEHPPDSSRGAAEVDQEKREESRDH